MRLINTLLATAILLSGFSLSAQNFNYEIISKKLAEEMENFPEDFYSVHFMLADQVDLSLLDAQLTSRRSSLEERAETVIRALQLKALMTQGEYISMLENSPFVEAGSVHSYWVANVIFAKMKKEMVATLSRNSAVSWIALNGILEVEEFERASASPPPLSQNGIEPGLAVVKAPAMWAKGYTGYGRVAFTNDTGVSLKHRAIASRYRGWYVPREQTWYAWGNNNEPSTNYTPYDCQEHGTHVTGTMLGLDRMKNDTIGMAFNAQWIGAAILCGVGTEDNVAAFQWSLDPDGDPSTTEDMPDVINNSWYDPSLHTDDCNSVYVAVEEAMEAAGIAVVFSAGNEGPGPGSITPPHNINLNLVSAFTVGTLNGNSSSLPIADFSSRGPSLCFSPDSSLYIKPEVSAPGVSVRSCIPGEKYDLYNGTSMAAPHVSGAIMLLKEAFPYLTGKDLKLAIYYTCTDLGEPGEDNTYGMGVINVLEAFNYLVAQGNEPVSPYKKLDIMLVNVAASAFSCENQIVGYITVENAGSDTLTSFDVQYEAGAFSQTLSWSGVLTPNQRKTFPLLPLDVDKGNYEFMVSLLNPNGAEDERPLNNRIAVPVETSTRMNLQAQAEGGGEVCKNSTALLRAEYSGPGSFSVKWFDDPFEGNQIGEGQLFEVTGLTESKTYYAEASYVVPVGLENDSSGVAVLSNDVGKGLKFDAYFPITLKSVKVYVDSPGSRLIQLQDRDGNSVKQGIFSVPNVGENRIEINWKIQPGKNYALLKTGGKPLFLNTSGITFPYSYEDVIKISGTTDGPLNHGWYFFYDWEIEFTEPCGRTPVALTIQDSGSLPDAQFSVSTDSVILNDNLPVEFFNNSTDEGLSYHWNFGDGTTSNESNPIHYYNSVGEFIVSLAVASDEGCKSFARTTITVSKLEISQVKSPMLPEDFAEVFPNPVSETISVYFNLAAPKQAKLYLTDLTGRLLQTAVFTPSGKDEMHLDASTLESGVYILLIEIEGNRKAWKVVKL